VIDPQHSQHVSATHVPELVARAERLATAGTRRLLAIAGPPGSGKSTLAAALLDQLPAGHAALVPQDGFHLADTVLADLGFTARKGAPETFDAEGFFSLLTRLRNPTGPVIYAPNFNRELEMAVAGSVPVPLETPLVIVEGNYLLLDYEPWKSGRALFDETWYLDVADTTRQSRLIQRHQEFGRSPEQAAVWALGSDEQNADVVRRSAGVADLIIHLAQRDTDG
jgi:Panthothenate kinase